MGLHRSRLVLADRVTLKYPAATPTLDAPSRQTLSRRVSEASITLRGQLELDQQKRRRPGDIGAEQKSSSTLILDRRECDRRGYTPTAGHTRIVAVTWHDGSSDELNMYVEEVTKDAAGGVYRCRLSDRNPERAAA